MSSERVEWVEIIEPKTKEHMYANLTTGECVWDPPEGVKVKRTSSSQWWELFDINTHRFYYYNASTKTTVWHRPIDCDIIPLAKLQTLKQNTDPQLRRETSTQTNHTTPHLPSLNDFPGSTNGFGSTSSKGKSSPSNIKGSTNRTQTSPLSQGHRQHHHHHHSRSSGSEWRGGIHCRHTDSDSSTSGIHQHHRKHQDVPLRKVSTNEQENNVLKSSINRSGSFITSRKDASDDSMHEKYFKSVESTPLSRRKINKQSGSSCDSASPQSPSSPQQRITNIQTSAGRPSLVSSISMAERTTLHSLDRHGLRESHRRMEKESLPELDKRNERNQSSSITRRQKAEPERCSSSKYSQESRGSSSSKKSSQSDNVPSVSSRLQSLDVDSQKSSRTQPSQWRPQCEDEEDDDERASSPLYTNWELRGMQHLLPLQHYIMQLNAGGSAEWDSGSSRSSDSGSSLSGHEPDDESSDGADSDGVYLPAHTSHRPHTMHPQPPVHNLVQPNTSSLNIDETSQPVEYINHDVSYYNTFMVFDRNHQLPGGIQRTQSMSGAPLKTAVPPEQDIEKYARDHLNLNKGIFRRKASVRDMLSWTSNAISAPMLGARWDKRHKRAAVELFKLVQIYMGDRKARPGMTLNSVAMDILRAAFDNETLRDELYVQLCRQTTENPLRDSLLRGWELCCVCLWFVPPSHAFQPPLTDYINRHRDPTFADAFPEVGKWPIHVQVSHYAGVACRRLERIGQAGRIKPRPPTIDDIDQARIQIFRQSMFGNMLSEIMTMQRDRYPNRQLPWVQVALSQQVLALNGRQTEGIFRVSADVDEVNALKSKIDSWELPDSSTITDAHAPASLLKLWYRSLYEPLIPDSLYSAAIAAHSDSAAALRLLHRLPPLNRRVLTYLISFLQEFTAPEVVSQTKMDSSNLAMVFAPNCLRCTSQDPRIILENTRKEMGFLRSLIISMDTSHVKDML